jgi:hypothetical protein
MRATSITDSADRPGFITSNAKLLPSDERRPRLPTVGMIAESLVEIAPLGPLPLDAWIRIIAGLLFGFMIGAISSLLGVAGGEVIIPTLVFCYGVPVKTDGRLTPC